MCWLLNDLDCDLQKEVNHVSERSSEFANRNFSTTKKQNMTSNYLENELTSSNRHKIRIQQTRERIEVVV